MTAIIGTANPDLYGPWRPLPRIIALLMVVCVGTGLWVHAAWHPEASWYMVDGDSYAGMYEVVGGMLIGVSMMGAFALLVIPWLARKSVKDRIEVTIRPNDLFAVGCGRYSEISHRQLSSGDRLFSSERNLIESPLHLKHEAERLLNSLEIRLKPFVLIKVEAEATPAELTVIKQVFHSIDNVFDYRLAETRSEIANGNPNSVENS